MRNSFAPPSSAPRLKLDLLRTTVLKHFQSLMSESHDEALLREIVEEMQPENAEETLQLLRELLDQEQQVAHLARPHKILINIEAMLKAYLEG